MKREVSFIILRVNAFFKTLFLVDKDNDLRCRVNKRAHKLFGKEDNEHKRAWIEEEFRKRQQKRKEKERRKGVIDNSLGAVQNHNVSHPPPTQSFMSPQQQLDINYLMMLCNSLGIPGAARALIGNATATTTTTSTNNTDTVADNMLQEQRNEKREESTDSTDSMEQKNTGSIIPTVDTANDNSNSNKNNDGSSSNSNNNDNHTTEENKDQHKPINSSLQLLEFLHHIQQYHPQQQQSSSSSHIENNPSSSSNNELAALPTFPNMDNTNKPEEKLAALLASTLAAAAAASNKEEGSERPATEHTEFPLDAVLTLMQLNAGWRQ